MSKTAHLIAAQLLLCALLSVPIASPAAYAQDYNAEAWQAAEDAQTSADEAQQAADDAQAAADDAQAAATNSEAWDTGD